MIPLKGRQIFHWFCRLSTKYDEKNADKNFSYCLKRTNGKVTIGMVVYLCRTHGIDTGIVRKCLIEQRKSLNKLTTPPTSSTLGYISDDDPDEANYVVSKDADPKTPLPTFGKLSLTYPLNIIYERGQTP